MIKLPRARIILVALTLLAMLQFALAMFSFVTRTATDEEGFQFPLPTRFESILISLEAATDDQRSTLLQAIADGHIDVWVEPDLYIDSSKLKEVAVPQVKNALVQQSDMFREREIHVWIDPKVSTDRLGLRFERLRMWSDHPMRIAIAMKSGEWLYLETRGPIAQNVFGMPPGLWAGFFGLAVAVCALSILWRGLGPLETLAKNVDAFAASQKPNSMTPRGPRETRRAIFATNQMQKQISELMTERETMFAAMSHDLRTYLTRLRLRIEGIDDATRREKATSDLEEMSAIIEDSLSYARMNADSWSPELIDVNLIAREICQGNDPAIPLRSDSGDHIVLGDKTNLKRAIINLVTNAHLYADGCEIQLHSIDAQLAIDVIDKGPGLSDCQKKNVIKAFERGDAARSLDRPGTGLGFTIADRIANRHGGMLELLDRPGGGLIARLCLPKAELPKAHLPRAGLPKATMHSHAKTSRPVK